MMDIKLTPEQALLKSSIQDVLRKETSFATVRSLETSGQIDTQLWDQLSVLGWLGLTAEESGSAVEMGIVVEELARRAAIVPVCESFIAQTALVGTTSDAATAVIHSACSGEVMPVPLPVGLSLGGADGRWTVSGSAPLVDFGQHATHFVVAARGVDGGRLCLVSAGADGVALRTERSIARTRIAEVAFQDVVTDVVGGPEAVATLTSIARALTAVQCLGYAQEALERTVAYAGMRVQFGRPIGSFQAVQHHCANMATMTTSARFLVYEVLWKLSRSEATPEEVALVKSWASTTAVEVTTLAHQIHGGVGFVEEYDLHFFSRRAKDRAIAWGTSDQMLELVGNDVGGASKWL